MRVLMCVPMRVPMCCHVYAHMLYVVHVMVNRFYMVCNILYCIQTSCCAVALCCKQIARSLYRIRAYD